MNLGQNPWSGLDPRRALDILESRTNPNPNGSDLAARTDAGADVLHYLARMGAKAIRAAVAANPATPAATNRLLADDAEEDVRAELAAKIARLLPGLSASESSHIYALTIETLECLARDAAVKVRAILAEEIKALDCVPRDVVLTLARDAHSVVAAPILEYSPAPRSAMCSPPSPGANRSARRCRIIWYGRSIFPRSPRSWSIPTPGSANRRWTRSSSRRKNSVPGICPWR